LLKFKGGYTVKAFTIVNDWLKLRRDLLRRRAYCHQLLYTYLENAKKRGEISSYKFEVRGLADWRNKWKVTIYKPTVKAKIIGKNRRGSKTNTTEELMGLRRLARYTRGQPTELPQALTSFGKK